MIAELTNSDGITAPRNIQSENLPPPPAVQLNRFYPPFCRATEKTLFAAFPEEPRMRIVAWNCSRGPLAKKLAALATLSPDLAVLAEAPSPPTEDDQLLWFPSGISTLGVQVRAQGQYRLERLPRADLPNCVNPVKVKYHRQSRWPDFVSASKAPQNREPLRGKPSDLVKYWSRI